MPTDPRWPGDHSRGPSHTRAPGGLWGRRNFRVAVVLLAIASLAAGLANASQKNTPKSAAVNPSHISRPSHPLPPVAVVHRHHPRATRPNIVFVLTDDLSMDLLRVHAAGAGDAARRADVRQLLRLGLAVLPVARVDLHRRLPARHARVHQRRARGRVRAFYERGEQRHTFTIALQRAGYATAMMGKYLNGYLEPRARPRRRRHATSRRAGPSGTSPAGAIPSSTTRSTTTATAAVLRPPAAGLPDRRAGAHGRRRSSTVGAARHSPFFLELATFAPHSPTRRRRATATTSPA